MKVITTNRLNRFWKNGVLPIKNALATKLNTSSVVNNLLTTAAGYALDARQGKALDDKITALNGKLNGIVLSEEIAVTTNGNWATLNKPGYKLASVYTVRADSSYYIKGINRRTDGLYIIVFDGVNTNTSIPISVLWIKL